MLHGMGRARRMVAFVLNAPVGWVEIKWRGEKIGEEWGKIGLSCLVPGLDD